MTAPTRDQRVHRLLRTVEWNGTCDEILNACPNCRAVGPQAIADVTETFDHAPDCELAAMIAELELEIIPLPLGSTPA